jgi:hypothetical protein
VAVVNGAEQADTTSGEKVAAQSEVATGAPEPAVPDAVPEKPSTGDAASEAVVPVAAPTLPAAVASAPIDSDKLSAVMAASTTPDVAPEATGSLAAGMSALEHVQVATTATLAAPTSEEAVTIPATDPVTATVATREKSDDIVVLGSTPATQAAAEGSCDGSTVAVAEATTTPDEWQNMAIPENWKPVPCLEVQAPQGTTETELRGAIVKPLKDAGLTLTSIHFEPLPSAAKRRVACVRMAPPELPWKVDVESLPITQSGKRNNASGSVLGVADKALQAIAAAKVTVCGERLFMHAGFRMCAAHSIICFLPSLLSMSKDEVQRHLVRRGGTSLFSSASYALRAVVPACHARVLCRSVLSINSLPEEWEGESALRSAMDAYGTVMRVAIITNPKGVSKHLGIVEFALPSQAARAVHTIRCIRDVRLYASTARAQFNSFTGQPQFPCYAKLKP